MAACKPIDWSRFDHLEVSDDEDAASDGAPARTPASGLLNSMMPGSSAVIRLSNVAVAAFCRLASDDRIECA